MLLNQVTKILQIKLIIPPCQIRLMIICPTNRARLERLLRPFFEVVGEEPEVSCWRPKGVGPYDDMPFGVMLIGKKGEPQAEPDQLFREKVLPLADETGASQIFQQVEGGLLVAILTQYRYWTPSRARLCAAEILRSHMGAFGG